MLFGQIIVYSTMLFVVIIVFLFFRKMYYRDWVRKTIFSKETFEEEYEENRKYNELYQRNKQKKLMKHREVLCGKQKDIQVYKEGDLKIVDIAKPVGKWTKMVIVDGSLMQHFAQLVYGKNRQRGFWELFVKAQTSSRGKHKGKGR